MSRNTSDAAKAGRPETGGGNDTKDPSFRSAIDANNERSERVQRMNSARTGGLASADSPHRAEGAPAPAQNRAQTTESKTPARNVREKDNAAPDNPYGDDPRYEASFGHAGYGGNGIGSGKG